ncbi:MAG: Cna B-type domain-containing protein [Solobacterium sp.]|nr:Cna B-type domain-containing protein [Solobacterium sp.]
MRKLQRVMTLLICLMTAVFVMPVSAENYSEIETWRAGAVTIEYEGEGTTFDLYQIADVDKNVNFTVNEKYSKYMPSVFDGFDHSAEEWQTIAEALAEAINDDGLTADFEGKITDGKHLIKNIPLGLYLMVGDSVTIGRTIYHPIPTFVMVPQWSNGAWVYQFACEPKKWTETLPDPSDDTVNYSVKKVWVNDSEAVRPKEITVAVYKGNRQSFTVVLNKENNWSYSWSDVKDGIAYSVKEVSIPDGYSLVSTKSGAEFTMKNVYQGKKPDEEAPNTGDTLLVDELLVILAVSLLSAVAASYMLHRKS